MLDVEYHPAVVKEIKALDSRLKPRIQQAIEQLRQDPLSGKPLSGRLQGFRARRVGDYRIVYEIAEEPIRKISMLHIGSRASAYRKSSKRLS